MAKPLVSDELWEIVQPLLPAPKPRRFRNPGRKRLDDRKALTGILFVLKSGIPPYQVRGRPCWRRLRDWQQAGVWQKLHEALAVPTCTEPAAWTGPGPVWTARRIFDQCARAVGGGEKDGPHPTDRGQPGSKRHALTDANGTPLSAILTGANRHDVTQLLPPVSSTGAGSGGCSAAGARPTGPPLAPAPTTVRRPSL